MRDVWKWLAQHLIFLILLITWTSEFLADLLITLKRYIPQQAVFVTLNKSLCDPDLSWNLQRGLIYLWDVDICFIMFVLLWIFNSAYYLGQPFSSFLKEQLF